MLVLEVSSREKGNWMKAVKRYNPVLRQELEM